MVKSMYMNDLRMYTHRLFLLWITQFNILITDISTFLQHEQISHGALQQKVVHCDHPVRF